MKITLRQLQIFKETARLENISQAAENLFISQSAASMALAQLETLLGDQLFHRQGKKLILNQYGSQLLAKASNVLQQVASIERLTSNDKTLHGDIHFAASTTIANHILPKYLNHFIQQHPHINLHLTQGNTEECIHHLSKLAVDFAIVEGVCSHQHIELQHWMEDELIVFCHPQHPLAKQKTISMKSLAHYPWILREEGSGTRHIVQSALQQQQISFKIMAALHGSIAIKNFIRENTQALSCLSSTVIADDLHDKRLQALTIKSWRLKRSLYLARYKGKVLSEAEQLFLQSCSE